MFITVLHLSFLRKPLYHNPSENEEDVVESQGAAILGKKDETADSRLGWDSYQD
jgi:hypothetical protein